MKRTSIKSEKEFHEKIRQNREIDHLQHMSEIVGIYRFHYQELLKRDEKIFELTRQLYEERNKK